MSSVQCSAICAQGIGSVTSGPKVIMFFFVFFLCSTQLSKEFKLLINDKIVQIN